LIKIWRVTILAVLAAALLLAAGCGKSNVVATVNGEKITRQQLDEVVENMKQQYKSMGLNFDGEQSEEMVKSLESEALEGLINQTVILQEAKKMGIQVTKADVDKEIDKIKKSITEDKFKQELAKMGLTEPKYRELLEMDMAISELQKKIMADIKPPTEERVLEYYNKNKQQFVEPASYQVRHILVMTMGKEGDKAKIDLEARTKALAILEQIKQGGDFAELAKQKSEDPGTASQGGLYTFSPGQSVPEFEAAAKSLQAGEITRDPVKTDYGYHIIKMEKSTPEKQKPLTEVREEIVATLSDQAKQDKERQFVEEARKRAEIVNNLPKPADNNTEKKN